MSDAAKPDVNPLAVARRAAGSRWAAVLVSTEELQALSRFTLTAITAIDGVAALAEDAEVHDTPIGGSDVLSVLTRHGLYSQDLYDHNITERRHVEDAQTEEQSLERAGAADEGGDV